MEQIQKVSDNCISLVKQFEGLYLSAYFDPINVLTIGFGTIQYPDGSKVKIGDTCTVAEANRYLQFEVEEKAKAVADMLKYTIVTQHQFDALVSFAYNLGVHALQVSTLLKKVLHNPNDISIAHYKTLAGKPIINSCEFLRWVYADGKVLNGLVRRRATEANMYRM
jgi:lysozyme